MKSKQLFIAVAVLTVLGLVIAGAPLVQAGTNAQAACAQTYTVVAGDTLSLIAEKLLGDIKAYNQIADATNAAAKTDASYATIADPNKIEVGWKLCIPAKSATAPTTSATATAGGAAAGFYTNTGPAADASALVYLLTLDPNGGVQMTQTYVGKSAFVSRGSWTQEGNTVTWTLTEQDGKPSTAVVVLQADADKLTTTQDSAQVFGAPGFVLTKTPADVAALSGVYNTTLPAADASERFIGLTLTPDGNALFIQNFAGKDSITETGTWTASGTKATVNLTKQGDKDIQENFVFELQGDKLVAVEYNKDNWGSEGLTLTRVEGIGALSATAPAVTPTAVPPTPAPTATPAPSAPPLTLDQLGNATYQVQDAPGGTVTLTNGKAEVEVAPGSASKYTAQIAEPLANGTLNGQPYAAAVLITSSGGSGTFYNLAAVPNNNGQPGTGVTALLGDRIKVEAITFENNTIKVNYLDRKPDEPMTAEPTVPVTKYYTINASGALVETQPGATTSTSGNPFEGTWISSSRAADAAALLRTMMLMPDSSVTVLNNYVGKGVITNTGVWESASEDSIVVTLTKSDDRNINDQITFQLQGNQLVATDYNKSLYGEAGLTYAKADARITGTVSYLQRIALPDNAVLEVYLLDASNADAPAQYVSGISMSTGGKQVPLPFEIPYASSQIQAGGRYVVQAFISADGKLLFKNDQGVPVITNGAPTSNVEIIVESAQ